MNTHSSAPARTFAQELKELTKQKSGAKISAAKLVDYIRERAREEAHWGYNCLQLDQNNSNITSNEDVLKFVREALIADGFTQVVVEPGVIAVSWQ
jgi:hypothetical protein